MKNIQVIAIKKLMSIYSNTTVVLPVDKNIKFQLQVEVMKLGFILTDDALNYLASNLEEYKTVIKSLAELVGADKKWKPFYPNFPKGVFNTDESELFLNAMNHYLTSGKWRPTIEIESENIPVFEEVEYKKIGIVFKKDIEKLFVNILSSNGSITEVDKQIIEFGINNLGLYNFLEKDFYIPFKENLCFLIGLIYDKKVVLEKYPSITSATDVLRIACHFSGGDISLQKKTKFKLVNSQRRFIVTLLEMVINENDISKFKSEWIHLFHCLHIGKFKTAIKSNVIAKKLREAKVISNLSVIETALDKMDKKSLMTTLVKNPGDFARRMDKVLRDYNDPKFIDLFNKVISSVDSRVLLQMLSHFEFRNSTEVRVVIPKGNISNALLVKNSEKEINPELIELLVDVIRTELSLRYSMKLPLGKVWIDESLKNVPIPLQMRTASDGLYVMQRGSRIKLESDKPILRFFIHWVGNDVDLSACFLREDLSHHSVISYYNLKNTDGYRSAHSGDITYAPSPNGAAEFIDIDLDSIKDKKIRYIALDVRVYSGANLVDQQANAGWMLRTELGSEGRHFDARTVKQRVKLSAKRTAIVALFDLVTREVIWMDLEGHSSELRSGNNVASNKASISDLSKAILNLKGLSLYDLLDLHTQVRGEKVNNIDEATTKFEKEYVFKYTEILSEFV